MSVIVKGLIKHGMSYFLCLLCSVAYVHQLLDTFVKYGSNLESKEHHDFLLCAPPFVFPNAPERGLLWPADKEEEVYWYFGQLAVSWYIIFEH